MGEAGEAAEARGDGRGVHPHGPPGAIGGAGVLPIVTAAQRVEPMEVEPGQKRAATPLFEHPVAAPMPSANGSSTEKGTWVEAAGSALAMAADQLSSTEQMATSPVDWRAKIRAFTAA